MIGDRSRPPILALGGLIALVPICFWLGELPGALVGGALLVVGLVVSPPTLFAVAHVLLLLLPSPPVIGLLAFEAALAAVLFGDPAYRTARTPVPFLAIVVFVPAAWLTLHLASTQSITAASAVLIGTALLASYAIHRYQLVQLGLVGDDRTGVDPTSETPTNGDE